MRIETELAKLVSLVIFVCWGCCLFLFLFRRGQFCGREL